MSIDPKKEWNVYDYTLPGSAVPVHFIKLLSCEMGLPLLPFTATGTLVHNVLNLLQQGGIYTMTHKGASECHY